MRRVCVAVAVALAAACNVTAHNDSTTGPAPVSAYYVVERATRTLNDEPRDLLPGFGFEITQVKKINGVKVGVSRLGQLIPLSDLKQVKPSTFEGVHQPDPLLRLAFVVQPLAAIRSAPSQAAPVISRARRLAVLTLKTHDGPLGYYHTTQGWVAANDVRVPRLSPRPPNIGTSASEDIWIDVDLRSQTLVAYAAERPVFATLISAGVGAAGSPFATPMGLHRIVAKLRAATMDNLEHTNVVPYHYETVPHTQYIGRVALHGVFWHDDFGHPKSHGCINLSMADAAYLFDLTRPKVSLARNEGNGAHGTVVQVR
ncbi:MAG: L,D-transpeptidase [Deltaproteobacteria bacterium]|nr:L,D-transpeptidase [Deltaproteobacteria bacterium]